MRRAPLPVAALALMLAASSANAQAQTEPLPLGHLEWRSLATGRQLSEYGPLAAAQPARPALAQAGADSAETALAWRAQWHALSSHLLLQHEVQAGGATESVLRVHELQLSGELPGASDPAAAWQWSVGKKLVGWDVGYAFRPNDLVAQAPRRTLIDTTPEGRPLLQLERFYGADAALSLVWVNPQHVGDADQQRGADEAALATRAYWRLGAADLHAFGRWGAHTGSSWGAAAAWVASDTLELHGSLRWQQRHDGWQPSDGGGNALQSSNPWQTRTLPGGSQLLLGASWTGEHQHSLLLEAWHDGSAPSNAQWRDWHSRNQALGSLLANPTLPSALRGAVAGNLAWQTTPMTGASLRRDNLFLRWSWQSAPWQLSLDGLLTPADRGRLITASAQWQGDQWRLQAAWRQAGGPPEALLMQLPVRRSVMLAATFAY